MVKRILAARHYRQRGSPIRALADAAQPKVRKAFLDSLSHLSDLVPDVASDLMHVGQAAAIKHVIEWNRFGEHLRTPLRELGELHGEAGDLAARKINGAFHARGRSFRFKKGLNPVSKADTKFAFDIFDSGTQRKIRQRQDELIAELTAQGRDTIDTIVANGARLGLSPADIVGDVRRMIGLTAQQAQAVQNYRAMLSTLDRDALRRQLRNSAWDGVIDDAIRSGQSLDDVFIDLRVREYEDNYLDYRANAIAETESTAATSTGIRDGYEQAIDRGDLPAEAVRRFWQLDLDENTCPICISIPEMNPDGVGVGEPFQSIDGPQDDSPVHTHCRCEVDYVTNLDMVPEND